jgi:catechol 2,3-dioxygenase-like lactoylglutathione lyase family enzyme
VIDHVGIRVSDRQASERFYTTVFAAIGKELTHSGEDFAEWDDFALDADDRPVTRNLHIAFYVPTHELVHAFHRAGVEAGYADDGAPGPRPQYGPDYYGGFLRDPDGNSVEAVYDTPRDLAPGALDHLWLRARDLEATKAFYETIASFTGITLDIDKPDHKLFRTGAGTATFSFVASDDATENVHIAFAAETNEQVDAFHQAATQAGHTDNGAPGERAVYHPGYYGAFVLDPGGHNIEAVNHNR